MFSRFMPLTAIRGFHDCQAVRKGRRPRPSRRLPDRYRARFRLEGLEERRLLSITGFSLPHTFATLDSIAAGPDGNLWFTDEGASNIGMFNPTTGATTRFALPSAPNESEGIAVGADGNVWFTEYGYNSVHDNQIGMINPTTHVITEFPHPSNTDLPGMTAGPDGNLWFTEDRENKIGMINPTTHAITEFAVPTPIAGPRGITTGPDGNLWFTESSRDKIGMINPTTHVITEFTISTVDGYPEPLLITAGPDGNLWFTEHFGNTSKIGMINPTTHVITEFPTPNSTPYGITAGPDGNLWFTDLGLTGSTSKIGMISPATHVITEFLIPYTNSQPTPGITAGPDGNLWFTDRGVPAIGVITIAPDSSHLVVTQPPPANVTAGSSFGVTVQAQDSSGNLVTSFNGLVTVMLASNPGGASVGGTITVTASSGVASFPGVTLDKAASGYTLIVSGVGASSTTTSTVTVTPAAASQLVITQQPPATVPVNKPFALKASIEDAYGNVVTTASGTVSVSFANNPTGATLVGTLSVTATQGVASFTNLKINKPGSGYTLRVSRSGLSSATSNPIDVTRNGKTFVSLLAPAAKPSPDISLAPLVLDSPDLWGVLRFKKRVRSI